MCDRSGSVCMVQNRLLVCIGSFSRRSLFDIGCFSVCSFQPIELKEKYTQVSIGGDESPRLVKETVGFLS